MTRKKLTKTKKIVKRAFHEVYHNTPNVVYQTTAKKGAERGQKQRVAIALSKARKKGARIPRRKQ
jgi:hypothetical protein